MNRSESAKPQVDAALAAMIDAWNRRDMEAYRACWAFGQLPASIAGLRQGFGSEPICNLGHSVRFPCADVAVVHVRWERQRTNANETPRRGILTHILQKTQAGWVFVGAGNTDLAPLETSHAEYLASIGALWAAPCGR